MGWRFWRREHRSQINQHEYFCRIINQLELTTRELRMATKETLDALSAAATQLDTSRAASVAATEALLAALAAQPTQPAPDDDTILGVVGEIKSQTDALDAETAKAQAALQPAAPST